MHASASTSQRDSTGTIPDQIILPPSIALGVVLQGLRIRLGRSIVTLTGIICGIAFLMSIMVGQLVKRGVSAEDTLRETVDRMDAFVLADLPILSGKSIEIIGEGTLSDVETRLLQRLVTTHEAKVALSPDHSPKLLRPIAGVLQAPVESPDVIFLMGKNFTSEYNWKSFFGNNLSAMAATTIPDLDRSSFISAEHAHRFVQVARTATQDEQAKKLAEVRKERFRTIWIGTISLLVTVIGISNAMLMSVTERFREIGTMKCLGALSSFITRMFVMEATILGFFGGIAGVLAGSAFSLIVYGFLYGPDLVFASLPVMPLLGYGFFGLVMAVILSIISTIYPARVAAAMVPATALRSTI